MPDPETKVVGIQIPGEAIPGEPTAADVAKDMGWNPDKNEYEKHSNGKPWVDAPTYLKRQREFNDKLKTQLETVEGTVSQIAKHFDKQLEVEKKKMRAEIEKLKEKRKQAVSDGDVDAFEEIDKQIADVTKTIEAPAELAPEVKAWQEKNPWYLSDPDLAEKADAIAMKMQQDGVKNTKQILDRIDRLMTADVKQYNDSKRTRTAHEPVDTTGGPEHKNTGKHTLNDLNAIQKDVWKKLEKSGTMMIGSDGKPKKMSSADYIQQLEEQGEFA